MIALDLIRAPQSWILILIGILLLVYRSLRNGKAAKVSPPAVVASEKKQEPEYNEDAYAEIEPLTEFDWEKTEPIKIRPFKPKYYLTMAIENVTMSDLVAMDNTYAWRSQLRKTLIEERQGDVLQLNTVCEPAVMEFYEWMVKTYLPGRFPTIFSATPAGLKNAVTGDVLPFHAQSAEEALRIIGRNVDGDFLFLLPIPASEGSDDAGKYRLEGFITCFPSGFDTTKKLGLKLADIHIPVPSYREKLEKSMDRFFSMLPVGKIVKRHNWAITTTRDLLCLAGNHATSEQLEKRKREGNEEQVDIDNTMLRCERQTLHRLPKTKALVFGFKTYQYPMRDIREEGSGPELAEAIEGLGKGNAPGMNVYKKQVVWGDKVTKFLRGEIDG